MNYVEFERKLRTNIKGIKATSGESNNVVTPWIVGFVSMKNGWRAEISYGTEMSNNYLIGVTFFNKGVIIEGREYNKCFKEDEINNINEYLEEVSQKG